MQEEGRNKIKSRFLLRLVPSIHVLTTVPKCGRSPFSLSVRKASFNLDYYLVSVVENFGNFRGVLEWRSRRLN